MILDVAISILSLIATVLSITVSIALVMILLLFLATLIPFVYDVSISFKSGTNSIITGKASWFFGLLQVRDLQAPRVSLLGIPLRFPSIKSKKSPPLPDHIEQHTSDNQSTPAPEKSRPKLKKPKSKPKKANIFTTISKTSSKASEYFQTFNDYPNKSKIMSEAIRLTKKVTRAIRPSTLELNASYGTKDPSTTGIVSAAIFALSPLLEDTANLNISLSPNFTQEVLEGNIRAKGSIQVFSLFLPFVRFLTKKEVIKLIRDILRRTKNG